MSSKSEQDLTGRNRDRGTLMPLAALKCLIAAPTAVSSWMTARPSSVTLLLTMISIESSRASTTRLTALMLTHTGEKNEDNVCEVVSDADSRKEERGEGGAQLLVLKILNFLIDLKSSRCASGT